jgi:DNA-binding transcriptional LysR family regulator
MNEPIDLSAVAVFAKVVEVAGFRSAAKALGVPRSTVSEKVARLEAQLGVRLLDRTTRVVRPTDAGRMYLRSAVPALESLADAARTVADLQAEPSGLLRVTAPPELGQFLFGRVLASYLTDHPAVKIEVELTARRVNLLEEGFDLALRAGALSDSTLISRAVGSPEALVVCASPAYLARRGTPRHPRDLARHDCLVMSERQEPLRWEFREKRKRVTVDVTARVSVNSFTVLRDLAVAGHGVARLPGFLAQPLLRARSLREILARFAPPRIAYHVLYPLSRRVSSKTQTFIEVLARETRAARS